MCSAGGTALVPRRTITFVVSFPESADVSVQAESVVVGERIDQSGPFAEFPSVLDYVARRRESGQGRRMLDLCCGTGVLLRAFAGDGWDVVGVDPSRCLVEAAVLRLEGRGQVSQDTYRGLSTERIGSFDVVVGFDDLARCVADLSKLDEILQLSHGLLNSGGVFLFHRERTSEDKPSEVVDRAVAAGFARCWRSRPSDPSVAVSESVAHVGTRDFFVAERG